MQSDCSQLAEGWVGLSVWLGHERLGARNNIAGQTKEARGRMGGSEGVRRGFTRGSKTLLIPFLSLLSIFCGQSPWLAP